MAGKTEKEKIKIVVPGDEPPQIAGSPHLERLMARAELVLYRSAPKSREEKIERAHGARIIINTRGSVTWDAEELRALPGLGMITTCSIGTDAIDIEAARALGIVVSNLPGLTAPAVAEHLFALMLSVAKHAAFQTAELKAGRWTQRLNVMLHGRTLGVIGTGAIGAEMARLGRSFGMRVVAWTFHPTPARARSLGVHYLALEELLGTADVVSLHVKLTERTRHLIGARELALMKPGAILVNGARGEVVDTRALCAALDGGGLAGAGLDVFTEEPLPADAPILRCENVVLTPHAADQVPEAVDLLNAGAVDNVIAFLEGRPRNNVAS